MITFITSLRHPETASNYTTVGKLFELCARSVCSQTHDDIRFIVVCNQIPNIGLKDSRIQYVEVDFPIPQKIEGHPNRCAHYDFDKGLKIILGTWVSLEDSPDYLYIVDADDWLDSRIAAYAAAHDDQAGFVVDRSYMVNLKEMTYKRRRGGAFYFGSTICPSLPTMLATFPELVRYRTQPSYQDLFEAFDSQKVIELIGSHRLAHYWRTRGRVFQRFPFFAASWVLTNGENSLGSWESSKNNVSISHDFLIKHGLPAHTLPTLNHDKRFAKESMAYAKDTGSWFLKNLLSPTF